MNSNQKFMKWLLSNKTNILSTVLSTFSFVLFVFMKMDNEAILRQMEIFLVHILIFFLRTRKHSAEPNAVRVKETATDQKNLQFHSDVKN